MIITQKITLMDMTPEELKNHILETIELLNNSENWATAKAIKIAFMKEIERE